MITDTQYFYGWVIYIGAVIGLLGVWWYMTRKIPYRLLRNILRLIPAVLLLVPFPIDDQSSFMAPALFTSMLEVMFVSGAEFSRAGRPVLVVLGMVIILYLVLEVCWQQFWVKRHPAKASGKTSANDAELDFDEDDSVDGHESRF